MAIEHYTKGTSLALSANFNVSEFACQGTSCGCTEILIDSELVKYLQQIRDHFGVPVTITSGYRCPTHNASLTGAVPNSKHMQGMAADIKVYNVAPAEVAKYAESIGIKGIGLYETATDGYFVHIDTRTQQSFWYGHAQTSVDSFGGTPESSENNQEEDDTQNPENSEDEEGTQSPENGENDDNNCTCTPGMVCEFNPSMQYKTEYVVLNRRAKIFILTCALGLTSPYYTVIMDRNACNAMGNAYAVRIGSSDSWVHMTVNESTGQIRFNVVDQGVLTGYICHMAVYS